MELAEGGDLSTLLTRSLAIPEVVSILLGVCSGIQAIHDLKIIHRNIKPENILLTGEGVVKISDFCCSREEGSIKKEEGVIATIDYISPEYLLNNGEDWRTDIYAAGLLGYELLTGQSPFRGDTVYETMTKRLKSEPKPPGSVRSDCPPLLDEVILRAIHRDREKRFQSGRGMGEELGRIA